MALREEFLPPVNVLVVEDNMVNQRILSTFMMRKKIQYDLARDGREAVEKWRRGHFHLILMDIQLPVMDGIAAAGEIAGERLAPVVMLTAFSQRELVERARTAGAMAYVVKPFTEADLVPAIELAVARFDELRSLEAEVRDLGDRLETRKIVDRAKALLQERMRLTEAESFRWIQKTSMDRRLTMREVAQAVIDQVG